MCARLGPVFICGLLSCSIVVTASTGLSQPPEGKGGFGQPGGKGFGPPGGQERKILAQFDKNGDGWLNKDERKAAREFVKKDGGGFGRPGGFGGPKGGFGKAGEPAKPGPKVNPADIRQYSNFSLYDPTILRTLFLEFENADWEAELQDFHGTDVEVPATLTVDGQTYPNVGVSFRGMSSYMGVPAGSKRSFNISIDMADSKQRLYGYKTLNLLNSHEDPSYLSTVLYSHIGRQFIPTPKANVVKVVINGESWGLYPNVQQFDKIFLEENYKTSKGARWKVRGSPGADGGLSYIGENIADYKRRYEIKSADKENAWKDLIALCRILNQTPPEQLEAALKPILDIEGVLWFLALDVALVNNDGYWTRASDYSIYQDPQGVFHIVPHDMNESFGLARGFGPPGGGFAGRGGPPRPGEVLPPPVQDALQLTVEQKQRLAELQQETDARIEKILTEDQRAEFKRMREANVLQFGPGGSPPFGPGGPLPGGPGGPPPLGPGGVPMGPGGPGGFGGPSGPGGGGVTLDPLVGLNNTRTPLRSKLLMVPSLRAKYLANVRTIAEKSLDWKSLGPVVAQYRALLIKDAESDTRKLESFDGFLRATNDTADPPQPGGRGGMGLRTFAEQRRTFLLNHAEIKKLAP